MTAVRPHLILACGPVGAPPNAIVIDCANACFWHRGVVRPDRPLTGYWPRRRAFRVIAALLLRAPDLCSWDDLIAHVWGDDPNGGPNDPRNWVFVALRRRWVADIINWLGYRIRSEWGRGMRCEPVQG